MHRSRLGLLLASWLVVQGCSSNDNNQQPAQCPPCGVGTVCDPALAQCVPAPPGGPTCPVACGANANCLADGTCGCAAGFFDCDQTLNLAGGNGCECASGCSGAVCATPGPGPTPDGGVTPPPVVDPCRSGCPDDQRCEAGACVAINAGEVVAELRLDHIFNEWDDSAVRQRHGEVSVSIFDAAPLPADNRQVFQLPNTGGSFGQSCTYEENTRYPTDYPSGTIWPPGERLSGGAATLSITGAPGPVEAKVRDSSISGHTYYHDDVPPTLREGSATYLGLFSADYVPAGATFSVAFAGGPDVAAASFSGGSVAEAFTIESPSHGAQVSTSGPLTISWSPPVTAGKMRVLLEQSKSGSVQVTRRAVCLVDDSGTVQLPATLVNNFVDKAQLRLERWAVAYPQGGTTSAGKPLWVKLVGRYITSRTITIQ